MPDLAGRVSLSVWNRPSETLPKDDRNVLVLYKMSLSMLGEPEIASGDVVRDRAGMISAWAELPTPSEATWRDLKHTVDIAEEAWGGTDPEVTRVVALIADGEGDP